jgi:hypothetical protein
MDRRSAARYSCANRPRDVAAEPIDESPMTRSRLRLVALCLAAGAFAALLGFLLALGARDAYQIFLGGD